MTQLPEITKQDFLDIMRRFRRGAGQSGMTPQGVTPSEGRVVLGIYAARREGAPAVQPRHIAEQMHTTPSALSQTLKALEEKGYIERHRLSDDCRAVSLELTDAGVALAHEAERLRDEHLGEMVAYVGKEDVAHLIRTLNKIVDFHELKATDGSRSQNGPPLHPRTPDDPEPTDSKGYPCE